MSMKIISWNCNGAFRKKFHLLAKYDADILVIQECENPSLTYDEGYKHFAQNYLWIGDNKNKGLGIFAKQEILIEKLDWSNIYEGMKVNYFLPVRISDSFDLVGVWAHSNNSPTFGYIGQVWKYLQINLSRLNNTFMIGDFNSNAKWDVWDRWWNHSDVVKLLESKNILSAHHFLNNINHGQEVIPTYLAQKNKTKTYHIDYCFVPKEVLNAEFSMSILSFDDWILYSDHIPLVLDV